MKYRIENCNFYVIKELLESENNQIEYIEKFDPETTVVKFKEATNEDALMSILNKHPLKSVVESLKIERC